MADVMYQCAVNKAHTRKVPGYSNAAPPPFCCGKPMTKMQAAPATTPANAPKPQAAPATTPANVPKPQAPAQQPPKK